MARPKKNGKDKDAAENEAIPNAAIDDVADCYVEYTEYMGQIARVRQRIATMLARYENMGVHTKSVRACYRLANMDDAPDYVKEMLRTAAILKIIPAAEESDGHMTFLPGLKVAAPSPESISKMTLKNAFWSGYDAGKTGDLIEVCTFAPGSEEFVTWRDGWQDGRKDWEANPKNKNVESASPEVRKTRRGRAATNAPATQLEKDTAAYRAGEQSLNDDVAASLRAAGVEVEPVTGAIE